MLADGGGIDAEPIGVAGEFSALREEANQGIRIHVIGRTGVKAGFRAKLRDDRRLEGLHRILLLGGDHHCDYLVAMDLRCHCRRRKSKNPPEGNSKCSALAGWVDRCLAYPQWIAPSDLT